MASFSGYFLLCTYTTSIISPDHSIYSREQFTCRGRGRWQRKCQKNFKNQASEVFCSGACSGPRLLMEHLKSRDEHFLPPENLSKSKDDSSLEFVSLHCFISRGERFPLSKYIHYRGIKKKKERKMEGEKNNTHTHKICKSTFWSPELNLCFWQRLIKYP